MSKPRDPKNLVVGLDIGTSKIVCIVAEINDEGMLEVIGMGTHPSRGLRRGVVVNIEATVNAIQRALPSALAPIASTMHVAPTASASPTMMCIRRKRARSRSTNSSTVMASDDS